MCGTQEQKDKISGASEYAKDRMVRDDYQKKYTEGTTSAQRNIGQASGDMYDSWQMGVDDSREIIRRNTESIPGTAGPYEEEEDTSTAETNYSSSGQTQTSSGTNKKADLSDTDNKDPKGASANLTVKPKKKPKGDV